MNAAFIFLTATTPMNLDNARSRWKIEKAAGHQVTYWQQNPRGGWDKKA